MDTIRWIVRANESELSREQQRRDTEATEHGERQLLGKGDAGAT